MSPWQFLKWLTVVLNVFMALVVANAVRVGLDRCGELDVWRLDACRAGSGPGSGVSLGLLVFAWVAGNVVLRLPHLFQRPARSSAPARTYAEGPAPARTEAVAPAPGDPMGVDEQQLRRLAGLREDGILTEEEFAEQKARLLAAPTAKATPPPVDVDQLRLVAALRDEDILTEAEFAVQKAKLLVPVDGPALDVDSLRRLGALRSEGILTDDEFAAQKRRFLPEARPRWRLGLPRRRTT